MIGEVLEGRPEAVTPREDDHGAAILGWNNFMSKKVGKLYTQKLIDNGEI